METSLPKSFASFSRETSPKDFQSWIGETVDLRTILDKKLSEWLNDISVSESLFKQHVYENENLNEMDLRQHRGRLFAMLSDGESLAFAYMGWAHETEKEADAKPQIDLLDQKINELFKVLLAWHAPLEMQQDIPESFKTSAKEADEGKIVDFP